MSEITTNRDPKYEGTKSTQGGLYDVIMALKQNIMKSLNVATLAQVQSIDEQNQIIKVKPFPLIEGESEKFIECYSCMIPIYDNKSITWISLLGQLNKKDVVLVVFLNRNSSQNLRQIKKSLNLTTLKENSELHSDKFGVIVGIVYKYAEKSKEE